MKKISLLAVFVCLVICTSTLTSCCCGFDLTDVFDKLNNGGDDVVIGSEGLEFSWADDGTYIVVGIGSCTDTDIIIPSHTPDGERISCIGAGAFYGCDEITSVTVPGNVTVIGEGAFAGCTGMVGLTLYEGVQIIEDYAFIGCSGLLNLTIPDSVDLSRSIAGLA